MEPAVLESTVRALFDRHHEAFVVELFGVEASGIPKERVQELLDAGLIDPNRVAGVRIEGMTTPVDVYRFLYLMNRRVDGLKTRGVDYHDWDLDRWVEEVDDEHEELWRQAEQAEMEFPDVSARAPLPAPEVTRPPAEGATEMAPDPPGWMSPSEKAAYAQAITRAGDYARGLGNETADELAETVAEVWSGEDIVLEVDPERREEVLQAIREETAEALATHGNAATLARDLSERTGNWSHNWQRIAETELQGAYNEGRVLDGLDAYGAELQIAGIPETNACDHCKRVFLGDGGYPIVYPIQMLLANGTNVGKPAEQWVATIWPIHPYCHCDRVVVPPGMKVMRDGRLRKRLEDDDG